MPLALHEAGFGVGLLLLVLVSLITDASLCLMIAVARTVQANTYQELVSRAFGRPGFIVTSCLQFLYPFICECEGRRRRCEEGRRGGSGKGREGGRRRGERGGVRKRERRGKGEDEKKERRIEGGRVGRERRREEREGATGREREKKNRGREV